MGGIFEAEFERWARDVVGERAEVAKEPARPRSHVHARKASEEAVVRCALRIIDTEGLRAATIRRLAAEMKISVRTLYTRIGSQADLRRKVVALHVTSANVDVDTHTSWEAVAMKWCVDLFHALVDHPHLTDMMTEDDRRKLGTGTEELAKAALSSGILRENAAECCEVLGDVAVGEAMRADRALRVAGARGRPRPDPDKAEDALRRKVLLIIAGARAECGFNDVGDGR